jgi:hypothetical protein
MEWAAAAAVVVKDVIWLAWLPAFESLFGVRRSQVQK